VVNEGRLLARIRHPNVISVFGADVFEGFVGIWMELVNGKTLKDFQQEHGTYSSQEAVLIGVDLCRALAAVHRVGFVHRDIKAQNVMREAGGRIVLMDFGAAGITHVGPAAVMSIKGTPLYLAPEVLEGDPSTVQSDLYSLGVLLYYLVSGEFPVTGRSLDELRTAHARRRRRLLRDVRPDLPFAFVRAIDDATAAEPHQRPDSAGAMEVLLERVAGHAITSPRRDRSYRSPTRGLPDASHGHDADVDQRRSIAVLPFVDISPDRNLEYFCDGIAEEIINALTTVAGLRVVASGSAFKSHGKAHDVRLVGSMLNVGTVLEGSVRASGNRLRVISRLTDAADGHQLWSERFDRSLDDIFEVQDEIARAAVKALGVRLTAGTQHGAVAPGTPSTRDLDAYKAYLKGRHYWNTRTEHGLHRSATYFQAAVEQDPGYADAYAGLAEAQATLGLYGVLAPHDVMPRARTAAQSAIDILDTLSSPFATLGCVAAVYDWAWADAERHYRRAIALNPDQAAAHHWYAINHLVPLGRFDEAAAALRRAVDADPLSTPIRVSVGLTHYFAHDYAKAEGELRDSFELDAGSATARLFLGLTLVEMGRFDDAVRELETAKQLSGSPEMTAALGYACARARAVDRAAEALGELTTLAERRYVSASLIAQLHAGLGDTAAALDWLDRAVDAHAADLGWLNVRPVFAGLRSEPRFKAVLARLGL
jgi:TolB-like protein/Flp pilus assembly protein TadD